MSAEQKRDPVDFWYAVNNTEIVMLPTRHLETFGATVLNYHLVTELMDTVGQTRIREGRMHASRPQIITPEAYAQTILEGFGDHARQYVDWLREHENSFRILQYGYMLRKQEFSEHVVTENVKTVAERVTHEVKQRNDPLSAVVVGVDDPWDVCLVKLFAEVIRASAGANIREMEQRRLFDSVGGVPKVIRDQIEAAFLAASRNPALIKPLAARLHKHGLFEEYEDRFFALVKASKS